MCIPVSGLSFRLNVLKLGQIATASNVSCMKYSGSVSTNAHSSAAFLGEVERNHLEAESRKRSIGFAVNEMGWKAAVTTNILAMAA